jgi:hypothetical protein
VAELPHKTRFHELAHVVLGHASEAEAGLTDSEMTPRSLREVEAEAVALVCWAMEIPGREATFGNLQGSDVGMGGSPFSFQHHEGGQLPSPRSIDGIPPREDRASGIWADDALDPAAQDG